MWWQCSIRFVVIVATTMLTTASSNQIDHFLVVDKSQISIEKSTGNRVYKGTRFTGDAVTYYPSGQMATLEQFQDGRWHGKRLRWFEDGVLSQESLYEQERPVGTHKSWWSNGHLRTQYEYENGELHGIAYKWYRSGEKFKMLNYVEGEASGLQQGWRENGKLFANFEYRNGRVFGMNRANLCYGLKDEEISLN